MGRMLMKTVLVTPLLLTMAGDAFAQGAAQAEAGQKVYAAQKCAVCHSIGTAGNKKGPLDGVAAKVSAADLRQWIVDAPAMAAKTKADRKPPMKAYPNLSKADVDALVAYMQTLK